MDFITPSLPVTDEGSLYSGWLAQPSPASLQPLTQWTTYPDYVSHEAVSCPYTADMYVQPVCPSYTLVGTSSVLTYASQPLITNFAVSQECDMGPSPTSGISRDTNSGFGRRQWPLPAVGFSTNFWLLPSHCKPQAHHCTWRYAMAWPKH